MINFEILKQVKECFERRVEHYLDQCVALTESIDYGDRSVATPTGYKDSDYNWAVDEAKEDIINNFDDYNNYDWIEEGDRNYEEKKQTIINYLKRL